MNFQDVARRIAEASYKVLDGAEIWEASQVLELAALDMLVNAFLGMDYSRFEMNERADFYAARLKSALQFALKRRQAEADKEYAKKHGGENDNN